MIAPFQLRAFRRAGGEGRVGGPSALFSPQAWGGAWSGGGLGRVWVGLRAAIDSAKAAVRKHG